MKIDKSTIRRSKVLDWIARKVITLGGILIIGSVIAIVVLIVSVTFPLFQGTDSELRAVVSLPDDVPGDDVLAVGVDLVEIGRQRHEDSLTGYTVTKDGTFTFLEFVEPTQAGQTESHRPDDVRAIVLDRHKVAPADGPAAPTIRNVVRSSGSEYTLLWSDGTVMLVEAVLTPEFDELGRRKAKYALHTRGNISASEEDRPTKAVMRADEDGAATCAMLLKGNRVAVLRETIEESMFGDAEKTTARTVLEEGIPGEITTLALNRDGDVLYAGTANGCLLRWQLDSDVDQPECEVIPAFRDPRAITALTMVFGEVSVAVGDEQGNVTTFSPVRTETSKKLRLIHRLSQHEGAVSDILPSRRNKSLLSLGANGTVSLDYTTSGKQLLTLTRWVTRHAATP